MSKKLMAILMLSLIASAQAAENEQLENSTLIGDLIFKDSIHHQEVRFLDSVKSTSAQYIADSHSKKSGNEIAEMAARHFDANYLRNATFFPFHQGLTIAQQKEIIKFLNTPTGKAFLSALTKSNDNFLDGANTRTPSYFYGIIHTVEFDPGFRPENRISDEEAEKGLKEMFPGDSQ